jgi:nitrogen-specific signal transduction histidine kinase
MKNAERSDDLRRQLERMHSGIREIAHDISSPLGVLRMAVFYLQSGAADEAKRTEYYQLMNDTIEKVEGCLRRLRGLSDGQSGATPEPFGEEDRA